MKGEAPGPPTSLVVVDRHGHIPLILFRQCGELPFSFSVRPGGVLSDGATCLPKKLKGVEEWWRRCLFPSPQSQKRSVAALLMYTTWNLWKERNRRVFDSKSLQPHNVFSIIKEEVLLRRVTCGQSAVE